jgi:hypothetical protein
VILWLYDAASIGSTGQKQDEAHRCGTSCEYTISPQRRKVAPDKCRHRIQLRECTAWDTFAPIGAPILGLRPLKSLATGRPLSSSKHIVILTVLIIFCLGLHGHDPLCTERASVHGRPQLPQAEDSPAGSALSFLPRFAPPLLTGFGVASSSSPPSLSAALRFPPAFLPPALPTAFFSSPVGKVPRSRASLIFLLMTLGPVNSEWVHRMLQLARIPKPTLVRLGLDVATELVGGFFVDCFGVAAVDELQA